MEDAVQDVYRVQGHHEQFKITHRLPDMDAQPVRVGDAGEGPARSQPGRCDRQEILIFRDQKASELRGPLEQHLILAFGRAVFLCCQDVGTPLS